MPTDQQHATVLRAKCNNGTLYRNDAKLSHWLGIPENKVKFVLDRLIAEGVLRYVGQSRTGTSKYEVVQVSALTEDEKNQIVSEYAAASNAISWSDEPVFPSRVARSPFPTALPITDEPTF
ncbi:hypothetical protein [Nocardia nova]|uniref:hypothetical protein n=1 Tax=Nocardia nova TaxID=37330 RepID=UPI000A75299D|nr:hypothetical protein [Nocardia nova]